MIKNISVFCGSSSGNNPLYAQQAFLLGKTLAEKNITLVYGGASVGLMGAVADGVLQHGGKVKGVLPDFLEHKELVHTGITELIIVKDMHERKHTMHRLSDGVIALPGGFGTLDELFEILTWTQLGLHQQPVGLLNVNGYYNHLLALIQNMANEGFLKPVHLEMVLCENEIDTLLDKMNHYQAPQVRKWIKK